MNFIYTISNHKEEIIYVGRTNNFNRRFWTHKSSKTLLGNLLRNNIAKMEILEIVDIKDAIQFEHYWICQMQKWGFELSNKKKINKSKIKFKK